MNALIQFHEVFFEEAAEHLERMEQLLLALDLAAPVQDDLDAIFRAAHSIKGGAATFGFADLAEVTHVLENLLDRLRNREMALRPEMVDAFLAAGDALRAQLAAHRDGAAPDEAASVAAVARLRDFAAGGAGLPVDRTLPAEAGRRYRILYAPADAGADAVASLAEELRRFGDVAVSSEDAGGRRLHALSVCGAIDPGGLHDILGYVAAPDEYRIEDEEGGSVRREDADAAAADAAGYGFFEPLPAPSFEGPGYGFFEPLPEAAAGPAAAGDPAPTRPAAPVRPERKALLAAADRTGGEASIRVSVEKVDQMINLVGELVITQAMLAQTVAGLDPVLHERLGNRMAQLERNTRDIQESVMSIRMMPMSFVFNRFPRVVRDLAGRLGKDVELVTDGEATELDKGLIEKIVDPLTHLVRNSLDHGIETPEARLAAGKDRRGTLVLRAAHQGGNVVVEVEDDGAGLHRDRILAKARERGLPVADSMGDAEVWQLIFAPGFSTAEQVTDVSGRGVGMDVVKRNIDALGGRVELASEPGFGTKVTIRLPLTLAILDGLSVAVGGETFIVPLAFIRESLQPAAEALRTVNGKGQVVHVRGEYLPLVAVFRQFGLAPRNPDPTRGIAVIVDTGSGRVALQVDELLGQHQVVIKSLEANYRKVPGIAGATIMGDGRVALILDVAGVARLAQA